jgi:hypothetical protein
VSYLTLDELKKIRGSLDALLRKCKTDGLYDSTKYSISLIDREIKLKTMNPVKSDERDKEGDIRETKER